MRRSLNGYCPNIWWIIFTNLHTAWSNMGLQYIRSMPCPSYFNKRPTEKPRKIFPVGRPAIFLNVCNWSSLPLLSWYWLCPCIHTSIWDFDYRPRPGTGIHIERACICSVPELYIIAINRDIIPCQLTSYPEWLNSIKRYRNCIMIWFTVFTCLGYDPYWCVS